MPTTWPAVHVGQPHVHDVGEPFAVPVTHLDFRSPDNNLYIGIPHALMNKDPQLESAIEEISTAISRTFWANYAGWVCCQAALALAKRRINVDQLFMLWGPGGVGLSLITALIAAGLGPKLHKYFDPNVFYQDDEPHLPK